MRSNPVDDRPFAPFGATAGRRRLPVDARPTKAGPRVDAPSPKLRAAALTMVGTLLAVTGHLAGGGAVSPLGVVLLGLALGAVAGPLVRRELRLRVLLPLLALVQTGGHVLLALGHAHRHGAGVSSAGAAVPHDLGVSGDAALTAGLLPDRAMLLAHLAATVVVAMWLRAGEALLWQLWRAAVARLRQRVGWPSLVVPEFGRPGCVVWRTGALAREWTHRGLTRGPPRTAEIG